MVNVALERIERTADGYRVHAEGTTGLGKVVFEVDEVIACTGFATGLGDLRELGVQTFYKDRLPTQTPYWESATVPGIYFAGTASQGQAGMRKYGWPSHSASVGGFRFNAMVQARHIARTHFGIEVAAARMDPARVGDYLSSQATSEAAIWSQHSNLARQLTFEGGPLTTTASRCWSTSSTPAVPTRSPSRSRRRPMGRSSPAPTSGATAVSPSTSSGQPG